MKMPSYVVIFPNIVRGNAAPLTVSVCALLPILLADSPDDAKFSLAF